MELQMFAMVTETGTAAAETALCIDHLSSDGEHVRNLDLPADIKDRNFVDCTGNDALNCVVCGRNHEGTTENLVFGEVA